MPVTFQPEDVVKVTDQDGHVWTGLIMAPSVLWPDWWVVRRIGPRGQAGKKSGLHVHKSEMVKK